MADPSSLLDKFTSLVEQFEEPEKAHRNFNFLIFVVTVSSLIFSMPIPRIEPWGDASKYLLLLTSLCGYAFLCSVVWTHLWRFLSQLWSIVEEVGSKVLDLLNIDRECQASKEYARNPYWVRLYTAEEYLRTHEDKYVRQKYEEREELLREKRASRGSSFITCMLIATQLLIPGTLLQHFAQQIPWLTTAAWAICAIVFIYSMTWPSDAWNYLYLPGNSIRTHKEPERIPYVAEAARLSSDLSVERFRRQMAEAKQGEVTSKPTNGREYEPIIRY